MGENQMRVKELMSFVELNDGVQYQNLQMV